MEVEEIVSSDASLDEQAKKRAYSRAYYQAHKETIKQQSRAYRAAHKEELSQYNKAYAQANKARLEPKKKAYRDANKARLVPYHKNYRASNKARIALRDKAFREANRERLRIQRIESKYNGFTWEAWEAMFQAQGGQCAICSKKLARNKETTVDHNHATGQVRGLLCHDCNLGLGKFQDSPKFLLSAYQYVARFSEQPTLAE